MFVLLEGSLRVLVGDKVVENSGRGAILGEMALTTTQVTMFTNWVTGGGRLIAMRPDVKLASLLGVSAQTGTLADAYLRIDTSKAPGAGLVNDTIQFHGTSDQYLAVEAAAVATLHSDATHPTSFPAVTLNRVGSAGGQAAAVAPGPATTKSEGRPGRISPARRSELHRSPPDTPARRGSISARRWAA
jgi:hypothetical protein